MISVVGCSRTGKSSLLNRILLNRPTGFSVGASYRPCTKGLWIWDALVTSPNNQGGETRFILLDSEGMDANDADEEQVIDMPRLMQSLLGAFCRGGTSAG